jgi:hypothetical protein
MAVLALDRSCAECVAQAFPATVESGQSFAFVDISGERMDAPVERQGERASPASIGEARRFRGSCSIGPSCHDHVKADASIEIILAAGGSKREVYF